MSFSGNRILCYSLGLRFAHSIFPFLYSSSIKVVTLRSVIARLLLLLCGIAALCSALGLFVCLAAQRRLRSPLLLLFSPLFFFRFCHTHCTVVVVQRRGGLGWFCLSVCCVVVAGIGNCLSCVCASAIGEEELDELGCCGCCCCVGGERARRRGKKKGRTRKERRMIM